SFFFQAEDGIRDFHVTGVQTCALPIWSSKRAASKGAALALYMIFSLAPILVLLMVLGGWFFSAEALQDELLKRIRDIADQRSARSEERRVGKEWTADRRPAPEAQQIDT